MCNCGTAYLCTQDKKNKMALFKEHKIGVTELLSVIDDEALSRIAKESRVDYCAKVLYGRTLFYLLMYGLLECERFSQRSLEDVFKDSFFQLLFNLEGKHRISRSSISERLRNVEIGFFSSAYELIYQRYNALYSQQEQQKYHLLRVDSTMITETCNKLTSGMSCQNDRSNKKQVKYSIVFDGLLPTHGKVFTDNIYLSEDNALPEAINEYIQKDKWHTNIYVFDRGIQSGHVLSDFARKENVLFVGRLKEKRKHKELESLITEKTDLKWEHYELLQDAKVQLYSVPKRKEGESKPRHSKLVETPFRIIRVKDIRTGKTCLLVTNDFNSSAIEIQEFYKRRWDVEVFFRFIKQELNGKHLLSTNENGIKVVLYMTLIVSMLLLIYKRENEIGYKTAKRRFKMEVRDLIVAIIVAQCEGNLDTCYKLLQLQKSP